MKRAGPFVLSSEQYPFLFEALHQDGSVLWSQIIERPGTEGYQVIQIPPEAKIHANPTSIRMTYADGTIEQRPMSNGAP